MDTLDIQVNEAAAAAMLKGLTPEAMMRAWRRTLRKSARWLQRLALQAVSAETKIALDLLRKRVQYYERGADESKLWAGLNPFEADRLGTPERTATGVTVAGFAFPHAWIRKVKAGNQVYVRTGKARFPARRVMVDWGERAGPAFKALAPKVEERLLIILEKEIWAEIK